MQFHFISPSAGVRLVLITREVTCFPFVSETLPPERRYLLRAARWPTELALPLLDRLPDTDAVADGYLRVEDFATLYPDLVRIGFVRRRGYSESGIFPRGHFPYHLVVRVSRVTRDIP